MRLLLSLDLQLFSGEKTEKATPKKAGFQKKGQVAKSQDVNTAIVLLAVFLFLLFAGSYLKNIILYIFTHSFNDYMMMPLTEANVQVIFLDVLKELVLFLGPIMLIAMLAGIAANFMQVGTLFQQKPYSLNWRNWIQ